MSMRPWYIALPPLAMDGTPTQPNDASAAEPTDDPLATTADPTLTS